MPSGKTRRQYLRVVGAVGAAGLAGCSEDAESGIEPETEAGMAAEETYPVQVLEAVGTDISDGRINSVEIIIRKLSASDDVDLSMMTVQFVHVSGSIDLTFGSTGGSGSATEFGIRSITDDDDSLGGDSPTMNAGADRAQVLLDTGAVMEGVLGEGERATVRLEKESGVSTTVRLEVPETLSDEDTVTF